ncbi:MurR/RpiR family transcriptional regulator [Paracoccus sp. PAR01]|uniref:MurR/RpiR family transcriptional regulator n=1 Tax=Paracoccus sp. PAR01 TaxID=2769282 RepID=UPI00178756BB|nr:MurR/RpiR family transcriptional regulator [Paracoccus sp. PAR01]MBD9528539.1 MurR/RpiR family transcriptional regulator [Paracoccus sp. PAR01]
MDLYHVLTDDEGRLSAMDRKLAQLVLQDVDFVTSSSISELAERAGVSPPSVTRFCRHVGCSGFSDFKVQLARMTYVGLRYLRPEVPTSAPEEVAEDIVTKAQNALFQLHKQLDPARLNEAAHLLRGAGFILAFGSGGNSSMISNELQNRLFRLGCNIHSSNDRAMDLMLSAAATEGTVAIVSSMTGRDMDLVRCLELMRARGVPTIALTQSESPVAAAAGLTIPIDLAEGRNIFRPTSTRYAYLAVVDILANLVAYADRPRAMAVLRRIKEELVRSRDGDDRQLLGD